MNARRAQSDSDASPKHYLMVVARSGPSVEACKSALMLHPDIGFVHFIDAGAARTWAAGKDVIAVVVDEQLPSIDGVSLLRQLEIEQGVARPHTIVLSKKPFPTRIEHARELGVDDIVHTHMPSTNLVGLVRSAISLRLAERDLWSAAKNDADVAPAPPGAEPETNRGRRLLAIVLAIAAVAIVVLFFRRHPAIERGVAAGVPAAAASPAARADAPPPADARRVLRPPLRVARTPHDDGLRDAGAPRGARYDRWPSPPPAVADASPGRGFVRGIPSGGRSTTDVVACPTCAAAGSAIASPPERDGPARPPLVASAAQGGSASGVPAARVPSAAGSLPAGGAPPGRAGDLPPGASVPTAARHDGGGGAPDRARAVTGPDGGGSLVLDGSGRAVAADAPDVARPPASTLKVLTAAAALDTLGLPFRFRTKIVMRGLILDGVLHGALGLVGAGDPVLSLADLDAGVAFLAAHGVRRVDGPLFVDATAFRAPEHNAHWSYADRDEPYAAGTSAVSLDEGLERERSGGTRLRPIDNQQTYAGLMLRRLLAAHGVVVDGPTRYGAFGGGRTLWVHESPPVSDLVKKMLTESDNHIAEQLLREIGRVGAGEGSDAAGAAVVRADLSKRGVPIDGLELRDGSGLSLDDRMTPRTLATLLWTDATSGGEIRALLPPFGAAGNVLAKTGYAGSAEGLAGYVSPPAGAPLSFSFLGTAAGSERARALQIAQQLRVSRMAADAARDAAIAAQPVAP